MRAQAKVEIRGNLAKVLKSNFYLCPHSKPHLQNNLIDLKDFLTQTQGIEKIFAVWEHKLRYKKNLRDLTTKNGGTLVVWYRGKAFCKNCFCHNLKTNKLKYIKVIQF